MSVSIEGKLKAFKDGLFYHMDRILFIKVIKGDKMT